MVGVKVDGYRINRGVFVPRLHGIFLNGPIRTWPAIIEYGRGLLTRHACFRVFYTVTRLDKTWPARVQEALVFRLYNLSDVNGIQLWSLEATDYPLVHSALEKSVSLHGCCAISPYFPIFKNRTREAVASGRLT